MFFLSWCSTLTDDERDDIARMMKRQKYAANEKIIEQGDTSDTFYVIEIGEVQFSVMDQKTKTVKDVGTFFQNQFFGEGSLLNNAPRRATATAITANATWETTAPAITNDSANDFNAKPPPCVESTWIVDRETVPAAYPEWLA